MTSQSSTSETATTHEILDVQQTDCCIVGGGPAGAVLALLLARQGISVMLLEMHKDFDREFRGDTIHPSVMEIMAEIGLADRLLQLPHTQIPRLSLQTDHERITAADFTHFKTPYPYIALLPQVRFLEFITQEAQRYPNFQLIMGANVQELVESDGVVQGVRYKGHGGWHEIRATLTVGADGRFSRLRQYMGVKTISTSPPMDILWFRLPRYAKDSKTLERGVTGRIKSGHLLAIIDRADYLQLGYVIAKGSYQELREKGIEALRQSIADIAPEFSDRINHLQDWSQIAFLAVSSDRLSQWYRPGLLLIGDAAHIMSPVGGVGINYAIQDAVVAANVLSNPLKSGQVQPKDLATVQRKRELPTRIIQLLQATIQKRIIARALNTKQAFRPPIALRLPILRDIPARLIAFGIWPVHVKEP